MQRGIWRENTNTKAGMTLIEVLVATVIFATVVLMLFAMMSNSTKMKYRAQVETLTTITAQMLLEEQYGKTVEELDDLIDNPTGTETIFLSDDVVNGDSVVLNYVWVVAPVAGFENGLIKVSVTVHNDFFEVETSLESIIRLAPSGP